MAEDISQILGLVDGQNGFAGTTYSIWGVGGLQSWEVLLKTTKKCGPDIYKLPQIINGNKNSFIAIQVV